MAAIAAAVAGGAPGGRYLLGAEFRSYAEVGAVAAEAAGRRSPRWTLPRPVAGAIGWTEIACCGSPAAVRRSRSGPV